MKEINYSVSLEIDGIPVPVSLVLPLVQSDPFPGGHKYCLRISGKKLEKIFDQFPPGIYLKPEMDIVQSLFGSAIVILSRSRRDVNNLQSLSYFLNSIDKVVFSENEIMIEGECSEVVHSK
jgi:hypothetical protein